MTTPTQAEKMARSLNYRRRLNERVPELEAKLKSFLIDRANQNGKEEKEIAAKLGTYKVTLKKNDLRIEEVDPIHPDQKKFQFINGGVKDEERKSRAP